MFEQSPLSRSIEDGKFLGKRRNGISLNSPPQRAVSPANTPTLPLPPFGPLSAADRVSTSTAIITHIEATRRNIVCPNTHPFCSVFYNSAILPKTRTFHSSVTWFKHIHRKRTPLPSSPIRLLPTISPYLPPAFSNPYMLERIKILSSPFKQNSPHPSRPTEERSLLRPLLAN